MSAISISTQRNPVCVDQKMKLSDRAFILAKDAFNAAKHADAKELLESEFPDYNYDQIAESFLEAAHMVDDSYDIGDRIRLNKLNETKAMQELRQKHPGFSDDTYKSVIAHGLFISR
jgi:hypothetical protein